jgi:hypothetical protein
MATNPFLLNSSVNLGISSTPPDGIKNIEVRELYSFTINVANNLLRAIEQFVGITTKDISQWPQLVPSDTLLRNQTGRFYVVASENIAFNAFVNLHNVAGVCNVRNANSVAKPAHGYCNIPGGVIAGNITEVILSQGLLILGGLLPGQAIFLSVVNGVASTVPDVAAGHIEQFLGIGVAPGIAYIDISLGQYVQH